MIFKDRIEQHTIEIKQPPAQFSVQKLDGKQRLSVNGRIIWTLTDAECTEEVLRAIMHAYFTGVGDMHMLFSGTLNHIFITGDLVSKFEDEEL